MCPCNPNDISIDIPSGPSGPAILPFGIPFALKIPDFDLIPDGFPEDLLDLLNKLQMLIPPGALKPALNPNFGKDIFDAIMKLLDLFFPFLMLYKFFLPILKLILCIIEVLCAIPNPSKINRAMKRLFRNCIPDFLNLFPIFALIIMLISLLLLLIALIKYIIQQILKLIKLILRNLIALNNAIKKADENAIKAIAKKLGQLLCIFQNLFVLLAIFNIIIQIIKDIIGMSFAIPPCDDTDPSDPDGCCTPDVCPAIVKTDYTRTTGLLQYFNRVTAQNTIPGLPPGLPPEFSNFNFNVREESWQIYDPNQEIAQKFSNIIDGYDITITPKPVFFPTDGTYTASTNPKQAPYTIDLRLFYNPANWGRTGASRHIRFTDCIVTNATSLQLLTYNNSGISEPTGVLKLAGGLGYEDDGYTKITGFADDGVTPIANQATLENFVHFAPVINSSPVVNPTDGYLFSGMEYTFKPNMEVLLGKNLVTAGCESSLALDKTFVNSVFAGDAALKLGLLSGLINGPDFPNTDAAQQCLTTALAGLRGNLTPQGVAIFQATALTCLGKLQDDTNKTLNSLIGLGFDPCASTMTADPKVQFTTKPIKVAVDLKERNNISLGLGLPTDIGDQLASRIKAHITFGDVTNFAYDGYQFFNADITSSQAGKGTLMVSFDNNILCTNTIPSDNTLPPSHDLQTIDYEFVYAPEFGTGSEVATGEIDTDGKARRDGVDSDGSKDGV